VAEPHNGDTPDILITDVSQDMLDTLQRPDDRQEQSLEEYVTEERERLATTPSTDEVASRAEALWPRY
jgi:hypothetical protein